MVNTKNKTEVQEAETKQKFLTYFLLFFPTIVILALPGLINGSLMLTFSIKILLAFYQFVALKTFIDKHYEYD